MLWGQLLVVAQLGSALVVETGSPDALCPDLTRTREAVAARLGTLDVAEAGWIATYTIGHAPDAGRGDFVRLRLRDPEGRVRLERDLPLEPGGCAAMAQALAVVLDRYFRALAEAAAPADDAEPPDEAPPPSSGDAATPGDERPPGAGLDAPGGAATTPDVEQDAGPALPDPQLELGLLAGAALDLPSGAAELLFTAPVAPLFRVGVTVSAPFRAEREWLGAEWVQGWSVPLRAWAGVGRSSGAFSAYGGPELLVALERGQGAGLATERAASRAVPGAGVALELGYRLTPRVGLGLRAALDANLPGAAPRFVVEIGGGERREVLAPAPLRAAVTGGVILHL
ncbi:MAG TPA: hypothetical protein PLU22_17165 [Polyangiaceae bacterium]|nr:hypothetical protein [Polyangiaceae bacterium]